MSKRPREGPAKKRLTLFFGDNSNEQMVFQYLSNLPYGQKTNAVVSAVLSQKKPLQTDGISPAQMKELEQLIRDTILLTLKQQKIDTKGKTTSQNEDVTGDIQDEDAEALLLADMFG